MKIVQNALFRSCGARFGQIAFLNVKVLKIVKLASNFVQNRKTVRFPWKLYKTLFSGHAQHVLAEIAVLSVKVLKIVKLASNSLQNHCALSCGARFGQKSKFSKSWNWPQILFVTLPNRSFDRKVLKFHTGLKFVKNRALFIKILQNALFRSCGARFGQIAFLSVKVLKMVKLDSNSLQNGKTLRFLRKLYKTLFSGHAQYVLAKSHFWPSKFLKSSQWPEFLSKKRKQCAFL